MWIQEAKMLRIQQIRILTTDQYYQIHRLINQSIPSDPQIIDLSILPDTQIIDLSILPDT